MNTTSTSEQQPLVNYDQRPNESDQKKTVYNDQFVENFSTYFEF